MVVVYVVNPQQIIFRWWSRQKPTKSPSNYCLAYLMMLLCRWCRAALIFFFVLCDLVVFFRAIKDDVDALGVLWLPRAFMPCNATALCVERTFILVRVVCFFLCRTAAKRAHNSKELFDARLTLFLRGSEKVFVFGFFIRENRLKENGPQKRKGCTKNCRKSKAYLLSLVRRL